MRRMVLPVPPIDLKQHIHTQLPVVGTGPSAFEFLGVHRPEKDEPAGMERVQQIERYGHWRGRRIG